MKKLLALLLALTMLFMLAACDDKKTEGDGDDNTSVSDTSKSGIGDIIGGDGTLTGSYNGNYVFNPPTDNYHIVYGGVEEARVGNLYTYYDTVEDGYSYNVDLERKKIFVPYEGKWYNDTNYSYEEYAEAVTAAPDFFSAMEDGLIHYLRAFGAEESELGEELKKYYVGDETICGVKCHVFDSKGINAHYCKYWIDPSNGAVLKADYYKSDYEPDELTVYDINYTKMDQKFYPSNYDEVEVW